MKQKQDEPGTVAKVMAVCEQWRVSDHRLRSTYAMAKINGILIAAEVKERRLKTIAEDARRDRELAERMLGLQ